MNTEKSFLNFNYEDLLNSISLKSVSFREGNYSEKLFCIFSVFRISLILKEIKLRSKNMKKQNKFKHIAAGLLALACLTAGTFSAKAENVLPGDINHDGTVNTADSVLVLRHIAELEKINDEYLTLADMNGDGEITTADAVEILVYSTTYNQPSISFPTELTYSCGDRFAFEDYIELPSSYKDITFEYTFPKVISSDGTGMPVLEYTNTGKIKAFHPGTVTVTATASNGLEAECVVTVEDNITVSNISVGANNLQVTKHIMTKNDAYNETDDFTNLDGIIIHSTATPGVSADIWYNSWNRPNTNVAVHSFLDDKGVYQYLPFEQIAWHAGKPCNQSYIDFEICEPAGFRYVNNVITGYDVAAQQAYFNKIWKNATVYTAYLCTTYGLSADTILSHAEAAKKGIATNHGDPDHWFKLHNKTMDDFRKDVAALMENPVSLDVISVTSGTQIPQTSDYDFFSSNDATPFDMFKVWGDESLRY